MSSAVGAVAREQPGEIVRVDRAETAAGIERGSGERAGRGGAGEQTDRRGLVGSEDAQAEILRAREHVLEAGHHARTRPGQVDADVGAAVAFADLVLALDHDRAQSLLGRAVQPRAAQAPVVG